MKELDLDGLGPCDLKFLEQLLYSHEKEDEKIRRVLFILLSVASGLTMDDVMLSLVKQVHERNGRKVKIAEFGKL